MVPQCHQLPHPLTPLLLVSATNLKFEYLLDFLRVQIVFEVLRATVRARHGCSVPCGCGDPVIKAGLTVVLLAALCDVCFSQYLHTYVTEVLLRDGVQ